MSSQEREGIMESIGITYPYDGEGTTISIEDDDEKKKIYK